MKLTTTFALLRKATAARAARAAARVKQKEIFIRYCS